MLKQLSASVILTLLATSSLVLAEQVIVDEISVTATRRPTSATDVSSVLSIVSSDAVSAEKLITDSLAGRAGIYLQQTTPGQGSAIIRGLQGSSVLHLVDGLHLSNAIFKSAPTTYLAYVPVTAVERIEIIRGTSTSLYGNEAVAGVIQVVSRIPRFDSTEKQMRREITVAFDTAELQKSVRGIVDVGTNKFASSLSVEYLSTGDRRTGGGERIGPSGYTSRAARFALVATPTESESWLLDIQFLEQPSTPRVDELVAGFGQAQPTSSEFEFAPGRRLFTHIQYSDSNGPLGLDWKYDLAWQRIDDDRITRAYEDTTRTYESNRSDLLGFTVAAMSQSDSISWIVGSDIYHDEVSSTRLEEDISDRTMSQVPSRFPNGSTVDQIAVYANADRTFSYRHHLSGGIRFSSVEVKLPETSGNAATRLQVRRSSGDIGWIYSVNDRWDLVTNVGIGFRAPNVFDLGTLGARPGNRFNIPNPDLTAEKIRQIDVSIRQHSRRWQLDLAVYYLQFEDRITSVRTGSVTVDGRDIVQSVNAAESAIHGFEASAGVKLSNSLRLDFVLNYTRGSQQTTGEATEAADRIPPLSGRLGLVYDAGGDWSFEGGLGASANQDRLSDRDRHDIRIDPTGTAGWAMAGARANWHPEGRWHVSFGLNNLLDTNYRLHGSGIDAPGRNFSVSFRRVID